MAPARTTHAPCPSAPRRCGAVPGRPPGSRPRSCRTRGRTAPRSRRPSGRRASARCARRRAPGAGSTRRAVATAALEHDVVARRRSQQVDAADRHRRAGGAQVGVDATALVNLVPLSRSCRVTVGIQRTVSGRWSSVSTSTTSGGRSAAAVRGARYGAAPAGAAPPTWAVSVRPPSATASSPATRTAAATAAAAEVLRSTTLPHAPRETERVLRTGQPGSPSTGSRTQPGPRRFGAVRMRSTPSFPAADEPEEREGPDRDAPGRGPSLASSGQFSRRVSAPGSEVDG